MTPMAAKCLDLVLRSSFRDNLRKVASGQEIEKDAGIPIKWLIMGGFFGAPFIADKWQKAQQSNFMKGQASANNLLNSIYAAQYAPQGGLGVPEQYRNQLGLTSIA